MSKLQKKPEIVVFAGPNGSGKSTITELLRPPMDYVNADEIKKILNVLIWRLHCWQKNRGRNILGGWKSSALRQLPGV